jgi:hypothetical protein
MFLSLLPRLKAARYFALYSDTPHPQIGIDYNAVQIDSGT